MAGFSDRTSDPSSQRGLRTAARLFAVIPLVTGLGDIAQGAEFLVTAGANVSADALIDPALNSQLMFAGAIWFGYAPLIWHATAKLTERAALLRILFGLVFLSGLARLFAFYRYGSPGSVLTGATMIELLVPPVLLFWSLRTDPSHGRSNRT